MGRLSQRGCAVRQPPKTEGQDEVRRQAPCNVFDGWNLVVLEGSPSRGNALGLLHLNAQSRLWILADRRLLRRRPPAAGLHVVNRNDVVPRRPSTDGSRGARRISGKR